MKKVYAGKWTLAIAFILLGSSILWNMYGTREIVIADYYPVVLVFLGLELIIKTLSQKEGKVSLEGGSILLLVLIMIFINVMPFSFLGPRSNNLFSEDHPIGEFFRELSQGNVVINFDGIGRYNTNYEIEEIFSAEDLDGIKLQNAFGDLSLEPWEEEEIRVIIQVQSNNEDEEYVERLREELLSSEILPEGILALTSNNRRYLEDSRVNSLRMNYRIFLPEGTAFSSLEIVNEFGDVSISHLNGELIVNNRHGDVEVWENDEVVEVENSFGDVSLGALSGQVSIQNRHGDVTLENEEETATGIRIENEFGSVHLQLSREQSAVFDLHTRFGSIIENFDLAETESEEEPGLNEEISKGTLGAGGVVISVDNRHGNIEIEIGD